jgi:aspartate carbamoyltransferase catalytic subunit
MNMQTKFMTMKNRSLISIHDFTKEEQIQILNLAEEFEKNPKSDILSEYVIASLFFEPSTRTRLSFESAIQRLGGRVIGFADANISSTSKGESLMDSIKTVALYSDLIIMRHPIEGSARFASEVAGVPVINAGDGANQHPTQCLLDLYSIRKTQGTLENLNVAFVGDLKYGRTVHSLAIALTNFNCTFHLVSPEELKLPSSVKQHIKDKNLTYHQYTDIMDALPNVDILYMTRIQRERFSDPMDYEKVKNAYILTKPMLANTKPNLRILHPMPRVNEIEEQIDTDPRAYYFQQALNGVFVRQALLVTLLDLV